MLTSCVEQMLKSCVEQMLTSCIEQMLKSCVEQMLTSCVGQMLTSCVGQMLKSCQRREEEGYGWIQRFDKRNQIKKFDKSGFGRSKGLKNLDWMDPKV